MSQLDRLRANLATSPETGPRDLASQHEARVRTSGDELVIVALSQLGADHVEDDDGITGIWENGLFFFGTLKDAENDNVVVHVRGVWERAAPAGDLSAALMFANDWNARHVWPKAFVQLDGAEVLLHGEVTADLGPSPTLVQVENLITTGVGSALELFRAAEDVFPRAQLMVSAPSGELD